MLTAQSNGIAEAAGWMPVLLHGPLLPLLAMLGLVCLPLSIWLGWRLRRVGRNEPSPVLEVLRFARRDSLTGLATRSDFVQVLDERLKSAKPTALILVNLDRFGQVNNLLGIQAGDDALVVVVNRLRALLPDICQMARLNGDEFALVLEASPGVATVEAAALRIQRALVAPLDLGDQRVDCSASLGIALTPGHADSVDGLLRAAQAAMRQVKASGGGSWRFYDPEGELAQCSRSQLREDLPGAIAAGEIVPFYQPIMDLRTNALTGLEVLARWEHPTRGLLAPDMFIPIAEELRLAGQITQCLMRQVIRDAGNWPRWLYFAFNVSPGQLRELIGMIRTPPDWPEGELDPGRIEVEVTESALIEDIDVAREVIALLQARGTRVVLDDFGIGFSNFFHLRELPFDRIKIDKSFVLDMGRDPRADACVRAMLALAASLGIDMVAEGLENPETEAYVSVLGCRYGQGFLYSPPVQASAIPSLMRRLKPAAGAGVRPREHDLAVLNPVD